MIDKATNAFIDWCARDTAAARFQRSVAQGIIAVLIGLLTMWADAPEWVTVAAIPLVMAVLAPIQAAIGAGADKPTKKEGSE